MPDFMGGLTTPFLAAFDPDGRKTDQLTGKGRNAPEEDEPSDAEIDANYEGYKTRHGISAAPAGTAVVHRTEHWWGPSKEGCKDNTGAVVFCPQHDSGGGGSDNPEWPDDLPPPEPGGDLGDGSGRRWNTDADVGRGHHADGR